MNTYCKIMRCAKISHDLMVENLLLKEITTVTTIETSDELYNSITSDRIDYGLISTKNENRITVLPRFLPIYDNGQFTPFDYIILNIISKYTTLLDMRPPMLPPPKIYMKEEKSYTIEQLIRKIKEKFKL